MEINDYSNADSLADLSNNILDIANDVTGLLENLDDIYSKLDDSYSDALNAELKKRGIKGIGNTLPTEEFYRELDNTALTLKQLSKILYYSAYFAEGRM